MIIKTEKLINFMDSIEQEINIFIGISSVKEGAII
jgi:hypothetical protein